MTTEVLENLRQLHDAMLDDLREHYLDRVQTIEAYDPCPAADDQERQPLTTPAILLELESIDPGDEDGTERHALRLTWAAHCVLSFRTAQVQLELREFVADLLWHVTYNRWGLSGAVREPQALSSQPGEFVPGIAGYDTWIVRWEQIVFVGPDVWAGGIAPTEIWFGIAPKIGAAHVDDYWLIDAEDLPT
jgi:hypothetical protein